MKRCGWVNMKNPIYVDYHDKEWGKFNDSDEYLFQMLLLESFHAGLSWEIILNKRENFRIAYDDFDINKIINYDEKKQLELANNALIVRNRLKIKASVNNAKIFLEIIKEFGNFSNYIKRFAGNEIIYEQNITRSELSDAISKDLMKRGMKFVGSVIIYSFLQATGFINSHDENCSFK